MGYRESAPSQFCSFLSSTQVSSGAGLRGRGWDWKLPHICLPLSVTWAVEKDETFSKDNPYLSTYRNWFQREEREVSRALKRRLSSLPAWPLRVGYYWKGGVFTCRKNVLFQSWS